MRKQAAFNSVKGGSLEAAQASTQGDNCGGWPTAGRSPGEIRRVAAQYGASHPEYMKAHSTS